MNSLTLLSTLLYHPVSHLMAKNEKIYSATSFIHIIALIQYERPILFLQEREESSIKASTCSIFWCHTTKIMATKRGACQIYFKLNFSNEKAYLKFSTPETYCKIEILIFYRYNKRFIFSVQFSFKALKCN